MVKQLFDKMNAYLATLDLKDFYKYLGIAIGIILLISSLLIWRYYRKVSFLKAQIGVINEQRETAKKILEQAERIKKHKIEVDKMIAQDPGFRIGGYFNNLLSELRLADKKVTSDEISQVEHEGKYRESILRTKFTDMSMKDVTELLNRLDQNKRIFIKELELISVKKGKPSIDVTLIIATLEPKTTARE